MCPNLGQIVNRPCRCSKPCQTRWRCPQHLFPRIVCFHLKSRRWEIFMFQKPFSWLNLNLDSTEFYEHPWRICSVCGCAKLGHFFTWHPESHLPLSQNSHPQIVLSKACTAIYMWPIILDAAGVSKSEEGSLCLQRACGLGEEKIATETTIIPGKASLLAKWK